MPKIEPLRMCIVTREMLPKSKLIRLVREGNNLVIDESQKRDGRGYWITRSREVVALAKKRRVLERILKKGECVSLYEELDGFV